MNPVLNKEFEQQTFELVHRLFAVDGVRLSIYAPNHGLNEEIGEGQDIDDMLEQYLGGMWELDPLHPSHFEETDVTVISNSMLMSDYRWQQTEFYKRFFKPKGYFHNADMFFRQKERIIAVLTLIRKDPSSPFTDQEIELLAALQPFFQFSLSKVYLPKRVHDRDSISDKYGLTARELDVVELALTGACNKVVAKQLKVSLPTLRTHLQNIYSKVGVHSSAELISSLTNIIR